MSFLFLLKGGDLIVSKAKRKGPQSLRDISARQTAPTKYPELKYSVQKLYDTVDPELRPRMRATMLLVISHIDIDGVVTAYMLAEALKGSYDHAGVIFTKPNDCNALAKYLADVAATDFRDYDVHTALVDVAINQSSPGETVNLINYLIADWSLMYIIDHHHGWELIGNHRRFSGFTYIHNNVVKTTESIDTGLMVINESSLAAASTIYDLFNPTMVVDAEYLDKLLIIATLSDDLAFHAGFLAKLGESSGEERLRLQSIFDSFTHLRGLDVADQLLAVINKNIAGDSEWYNEKFAAAAKCLPLIRNVTPKGAAYRIGSIQLMTDSVVNRTFLFTAAYTKYDYLILSEVNPGRMTVNYQLGTSTPVNLLTVFGLKTGSAKKIALPRSYMATGDCAGAVCAVLDAYYRRQIDKKEEDLK